MGTKSKKEKAHRKKVANRNQRLKERKSRMDKMQREFIMNLIKQEQEKGLFDNSQNLNPTTDGPILDGPILDGPILDSTVVESQDDTSNEVVTDENSDN